MLRDSIDYKSTAVGKLFRQFLFPTVMGMVFSAVFVITDGIFVGKGIGSDALAAVNLVAPLYLLATGLGLMFGMGGSVVASINMAQGKLRVAKINITQALVVPALFVTLLSILLIVFWRPVLALLGTPQELLVPAREYLIYFTIFFMPLAVFDILMFFVRLDGSPKFVMACNINAALLNILLDYLFIFQFGWGLAGAAVATGIGYTVGAIAMLWYMLGKGRTLHLVKLKLSRKSMLLTARNLGYMAYLGFSALVSELAIAALMVVGNYAFIAYTGKDGVAAYSVACYIFPIIFMIYNGIIQSAQPIISYNYGIGEMRRSKDALRLATATALGCGVAAFLFTWLWAPWMVGLFLRPDEPAFAIAVGGLPLFAMGYPFFGINVIVIGYYQSIERGKLATGLTLLRGIILMALCFLLLPRVLGVPGIWLAVPAAELLITVMLIVLLRIGHRRSHAHLK